MVYSLIRDEGLVLGGSSGINAVGALRLAELVPKPVVLIDC